MLIFITINITSVLRFLLVVLYFWSKIIMFSDFKQNYHYNNKVMFFDCFRILMRNLKFEAVFSIFFSKILYFEMFCKTLSRNGERSDEKKLNIYRRWQKREMRIKNLFFQGNEPRLSQSQHRLFRLAKKQNLTSKSNRKVTCKVPSSCQLGWEKSFSILISWKIMKFHPVARKASNFNNTFVQDLTGNKNELITHGYW